MLVSGETFCPADCDNRQSEVKKIKGPIQAPSLQIDI
ncbi:hypothetical protein EPIR_2810 [Erwinia piriflorinigrans CFBP 5888]|uniref:Uncharacterized protein n=1 Tax=Erwinia piriflorinigrans CFBP 5888 TaxID=1161919 RepID=V5Z9Y5_9GAMM|nr:hypothetical protein EPIR_2810 [Erwinia piriflorinigrans CFBP 5888]